MRNFLPRPIVIGQHSGGKGHTKKFCMVIDIRIPD
jgi:hypothetical protein